MHEIVTMFECIIFDLSEVLIAGLFGIEQELAPKNDPTTFNKVATLLGASPKRMLFIDDNKQNIDVAESLGIKSIWFKNAGNLTNELHRLTKIHTDKN